MLAPQPGPVHVTILSSAGRRPGRDISLHRSPSLPVAATTLLDGITLTTPARTIQDLRPRGSLVEVRWAIRLAKFMRVVVGTCYGRVGELTRSRLERDFLRLCRRHRLRRPEVNAHVGEYEVDFVWRERRLVVETDGWQAHRTRWSHDISTGCSYCAAGIGMGACRQW